VLKTFPSEHQTERVDLLLADGIGFIQQFRIPIIANAAQVYISALAFYSRSTSLSETFHCRSGDIVNVRLGAHKSRTQCVATLEGHQDETGAVAVSSSGNMIVSGSRHGLLHLWDFNTGAPAGLPLAGHSKTISMVAFAPDGNLVASGSKDRTVRIWDRTTGDTILALYPTDRDALIATLAFSIDGTKLLIGVAKDTDTHSYEVDSIKVPSNPTDTDAESVVSTREWKSPSYPTPEIGNAMCALTMALSITTDQVAILLLIDKINVFDMSTRGSREVTLEIPRGPTSTIISQMVFSPTGKQIAAAFAFRSSVFVWDVQNGTLTYLCGGFEARSLAFSPDGGQCATGYRNGIIDVWDLNSRNAISVVLKGHNKEVTAMTYSPDGNHIVSSSGDETLRIWDLGGGITPSAPAKDLGSIVDAVAFSPDGSRCVVATLH
jgi:WD40 repeat protein